MIENKRFDYTNYDDGTSSIYDRLKDKYYFDMDLDGLEDLLNEQDEKINNLKNELFSVTSALIYETSSTPKKDIAEAKKEIYGVLDD